MLSELSLAELLKRTASGTPVPGGGSLSALAAAAGASLAQMVAGLTAGREQFTAVTPEMNELAATAERLRGELLAAMDRDAEAYTAVMEALRLPRATDEEMSQRAEAVQKATREAARVPLQVAEKAIEVMTLARTAIRKGNPNAVSDGAVGALLARAALQGALCNVKINLQSIRDKTFTALMAERTAALEARARTLEAAILSEINL
jgi:formiminotetrahydrofolate cyclodeaminase